MDRWDDHSCRLISQFRNASPLLQDIFERKPPPKAEKLVEFHSGIVKEIANKYLQPPLILVGKSMGSSCMVAVEDGAKASAVVCLGYPLKGTKGAIRDAPLLQLKVPTMFVQSHLLDKAQPDGIFNVKGKQTIQSESGQKQFATFED
ncbi:KAT8 regulatory NSL complex subunit 3 [Tanacetum coccineum]